jgi:hypothetical protein
MTFPEKMPLQTPPIDIDKLKVPGIKRIGYSVKII